MTAEEFLNRDYTSTKENAIKAMIEFAKYHVEKALKEASENADMDYEFYQSSQEGSSGFIDKKSILNAYPTNLIK